jgi:rhomboid protease GluP
MAALLLVVYRLAGARGAHGPWFRAGSADAARILDGETWRTVTALTLHADLSHLVGNVAAGTFLATAVCRTVGPGVGAWLLLLSGAIGNAVTAAVTREPHDAVGASTAVLGAVGVLSGLGVVRARRAAGIRGRSWVPFGAGLALLALLGSGKGTDLTSHLFGFLAGAVLGAMAAPLPALPRWLQYALALGALAALGESWVLALAATGRA